MTLAPPKTGGSPRGGSKARKTVFLDGRLEAVAGGKFWKMVQGTFGRVQNPNGTCTQPMVFIDFNLGILGDNLPIKYSLYRAY